jgi:hypothetical protein
MFTNYVKEFCSGGLYLYDSVSLVKWDNMDGQLKDRWEIFFDLCKERSTSLTEIVIQAIRNGLCPGQMIGPRGSKAVIPEKFWYWKIGKAFKDNTVVEFLDVPYTHVFKSFLNKTPTTINGHYYGVYVEGAISVKSREARWGLNKSEGYAFSHPSKPWAFLLRHIIDESIQQPTSFGYSCT